MALEQFFQREASLPVHEPGNLYTAKKKADFQNYFTRLTIISLNFSVPPPGKPAVSFRVTGAGIACALGIHPSAL